MYCPPPHFYHNIYFDWLVPPTYQIVPTPLDARRSNGKAVYNYDYFYSSADILKLREVSDAQRLTWAVYGGMAIKLNILIDNNIINMYIYNTVLILHHNKLSYFQNKYKYINK